MEGRYDSRKEILIKARFTKYQEWEEGKNKNKNESLWFDRKKGKVGRHGVEYKKWKRHKSEVRNKRETKIRPCSRDEKKEKRNETFSNEKREFRKRIIQNFVNFNKK